MSKRFADLIDVDRFASMMQSFFDTTEIPIWLKDGEGTVLFSVGLPDVDAAAQARLCDGVTEYAAPITIDGQRIATIVLGPVFHEPADADRPRSTSLPVVPRAKAEAALAFVTKLADGVASICTERLQHRNAQAELVAISQTLVNRDSANSVLEKAIAEERRIEQQLRRERDFSHAVINSLPGIFYLLDTEGRLVTWNRNMETRLGYDGAELHLRSALELFGGRDRRRVSERIAQVFEDGRAEVEATIVAKDGRGTPHFFTGARITLDDECYLVGLGIDITDRAEAAEALQEKATALERSNADLEQFAYVASHDLREPLRMVTNYVSLLERRYGDRLDEDARDFIGYAREGALRMDRLILDLLEYSRVGRTERPQEMVPSKAVLDRAVSNLEVAVREAGACLYVAGDWPMVRGCPDELARLFQNLIGNAIKYRRPDVTPIIRVTCERRDGEHLFSVRDNGIGIDPQYAERIFLIFQRLHTRQSYEGTGIGLAICRKVVERHGGRLWVSAAPDQGSTFLFTLPHLPA